MLGVHIDGGTAQIHMKLPLVGAYTWFSHRSLSWSDGMSESFFVSQTAKWLPGGVSVLGVTLKCSGDTAFM